MVGCSGLFALQGRRKVWKEGGGKKLLIEVHLIEQVLIIIQLKSGERGRSPSLPPVSTALQWCTGTKDWLFFGTINSMNSETTWLKCIACGKTSSNALPNLHLPSSWNQKYMYSQFSISHKTLYKYKWLLMRLTNYFFIQIKLGFLIKLYCNYLKNLEITLINISLYFEHSNHSSRMYFYE